MNRTDRFSVKMAVRNAFALIFIAAIIVLIVGLTAFDSLAAGQETKRVFVLNSYHRGYPFSDNAMRGIDDAFGKSGIKVDTYVIHMDMKRIPPTPQYFSQLKKLIAVGYKGVRFDAVIACDNDALEFMRKYRDELFPGVPVVFTGINDYDKRMLDGRNDITGTSQSNDYAGTISIAQKFRPATKNIVVVTDNTTTGKAHRSAIVKIRPDFPQSLGFTYLSLGDMTMDELAEKLSKLDSENIVLLLHHFVDKNGTIHTIGESASLLAKSSSVPIFVVSDIRIGFGTLGGHLVSGHSQGETAAQMAARILGGTDVRTIPVLLESPNRYIFDYSAMQRFSIAESDLPQGSMVINKPVSALTRYRNELFFVVGAFAVLCGLVVYLLLEIKGRRKIEQTLREGEEKYRFMTENSSDVIWHLDRNYCFDYISPADKRLRGFMEHEVIGTTVWSLLKPEGIEHVKRVNAQRLSKEQDGISTGTVRYELELICKDGRWIWTEINVTAHHDKNGALIGLHGVTRDITERKQAEEVLQESETLQRTLLANLPAGVIIVDAVTRMIENVNNAAATMFGIQAEEIVGHRCHSFLCPAAEGACPVCDHGKEVDHAEREMVCADGRRRPVLKSVKRIQIRGQEKLLECFVDITDRKHAEEALLRERGKLKTLSDNAPFGMVLIDKEGHFTYVNTKFTELFGFDMADIPDGRTWFRKAYPDTDYRHTVISTWREDLRDAKPGERKPRVFTVTCKDGTQRIVQFIPSMLISGEYLMTCEDKTEQKHLEAQLMQAQKLEAIGTLAGGIAHDFNNLLMGIQGYASLMMMDLDTHHPHYERLMRIEEQVKSAADLTRQLLGFARGGRYEMRPVKVNEIIRKSSSLFGRTKKELTIHGKYGKDLPTVEADQGQIEQVLLNLYVNAWHAMPSGGELYLETGNVMLDESTAIRNGVHPGQYVRISVTDTGTGMDEKTRKRIFDPFFTTKEMGRGTGLGLAMVYGIIKGHNGFINVYSEPGHGSTFTLYLPASDKEAREEKPVVPEVLRGSETILLVDDEPGVLAVSTEILQALGYTVHGRGSGQEAVAFYQEMQDRIALIILDMIMPGLSGSETFDRIRELNPSAKILLSSGYSLNGQAQQIMNKGCQGFIQKPFDITFISRKIREVLEG